MKRTALVLLLLGWAGSLSFAAADELLPADRPIAEVVDHYLDLKLEQAGLSPAPPADDFNLLRRTTLDLAGRIPTVAEAQAYVASDDPNKRAELVQRLLESAAFARHQANEFDAFLMYGASGSLRDYLQTAFDERRSWDAVFRELLAADRQSGSGQAVPFVKGRVQDLDKLTNDVSVMFFGVNISCAKCHDHPLVPEWTQAHFYGMKSFFNRTFEHGDFVGERDWGVVKYKTTDGDEKLAQPMFLSGSVLDQPDLAEPSDQEKKEEKKQLDELKKNKQPPPPPSLSRRAQLIEVALRSPDNVYFSRAIVNRVWYQLFGYGLVMPLDQMHPENKSSHPELLAWLARDLSAHDYDLQRLVRGLVSSRGYARSSRWDEGPQPAADLFAVALPRVLTPAQYATSLRLAAANPDQVHGDLAAGEIAGRIASLENAARGFAGRIEQPREDFQVSVTEALLFSNGAEMMKEFLRDAGDSLVGKLKTIEDPGKVVETAVWNVWVRPPDEDERKLLGEFLAGRQEDKVAACQQLVWTLLTSSELRFNY